MDDFTTRHLAEYAAANCNDNIADAGFIAWVHALDEDDLAYYERHGWPLALRHYREQACEAALRAAGDPWPVKHLYSKDPT